MGRTTGAPRRFSGPRVGEEVGRLTADAAPGIAGVSDWANRDYLRPGDKDVMRDFADTDGRPPWITDKELTRRKAGIAFGRDARPCSVLLVGVGDMNSARWAARGKARSFIARNLMGTPPFRARQGVEIASFYLRTNRSQSADGDTRIQEQYFSMRVA